MARWDDVVVVVFVFDEEEEEGRDSRRVPCIVAARSSFGPLGPSPPVLAVLRKRLAPIPLPAVLDPPLIPFRPPVPDEASRAKRSLILFNCCNGGK